MATMSLPNRWARLGGIRWQGLGVDLHIQVDVFGCHLRQGPGVHSIDERLHIRVKSLHRLRLSTDVG